MSRRGEQGEHFATSSVLSSRVLGRDRETASLLPLLTPEARVDAPSWLDALHPGNNRFDLPGAQPVAGAGINSPGSTDLRESPGSAHPAPCPVNPVILALVMALRDVEQRRGRGKVLIHATAKRPAA